MSDPKKCSTEFIVSETKEVMMERFGYQMDVRVMKNVDWEGDRCMAKVFVTMDTVGGEIKLEKPFKVCYGVSELKVKQPKTLEPNYQEGGSFWNLGSCADMDLRIVNKTWEKGDTAPSKHEAGKLQFKNSLGGSGLHVLEWSARVAAQFCDRCQHCRAPESWGVKEKLNPETGELEKERYIKWEAFERSCQYKGSEWMNVHGNLRCSGYTPADNNL